MGLTTSVVPTRQLTPLPDDPQIRCDLPHVVFCGTITVVSVHHNTLRQKVKYTSKPMRINHAQLNRSRKPNHTLYQRKAVDPSQKAPLLIRS